MIQVTIQTKTSKIAGEFLDPQEAKIFIDKIVAKKARQLDDLDLAIQEARLIDKSKAMSLEEAKAYVNSRIL